jgi:transcription elongation factor GreA
MLDKPVYVTDRGKRELETELEHLQNVERQRIIDHLHEVKSGGDWMENTEVMLFEDQLSFVDRRIKDLEDMLAKAKLIEEEEDHTVVNIGDTVVLQSDEGGLETFRIVGVAESDPSKGLISNESPLGQAILEQKVGQTVVVVAPAGELSFKIVAVK